MNDIEAIIERLKENEAVAKKFLDIETSILSILNFKDLFEVLLTKIEQQFKIPYVWISMIEKSEVSGLIRTLESSDLLRERMNVVERQVFEELVITIPKPCLVNHNMKPYFKLLPPRRKFLMKSMAIVPLSLDGEIIGSLNQADISPDRFQPGIDTSLLEQLAVKVSLCLSNVTAHEKLRFMAYHDPLTGLLNRRVMETVLNRELTRSKRYEGQISVVFVDLDDFKNINDEYGHDTGDAVLKHVADHLKKMSRDCDVVARYAGDEFVIILPETNGDNALVFMERVESFFEENPLSLNGGAQIRPLMSYGIVSSADGEYSDAESFLKKADEVLYGEKTKKKGLR